MKLGMETTGDRELEVLIRALVMYLSAKTKTANNMNVGMLRLAIGSCLGKNSLSSFQDVKTIPEVKKDSFFLDVFNDFFERLKLDLRVRRKFKFDFLQIYERWKSSYALSVKAGPPPVQSPGESDREDKKIEQNLTVNLDELDLGGAGKEVHGSDDNVDKFIEKLEEITKKESKDFDIFS